MRSRRALLRLALAPALLVSCTPPSPSGGTRLPPGAVFVALSGGEEVVAVDPDGTRVLARVKTERRPQMADMTPDRRTLLVATAESNSVYALNLIDDFHVHTRVRVGRRPHQVSIAPDGRLAVVTNEGERFLTLLDVAKTKVSGTIEVDEGPFHVTLAPDGRTAWVTYTSRDYVTVVDLATRARLRDLRLGRTPLHVRFGPGGEAWVADAEANAVHRIPPGTAQPAAMYAAGTYPIECTFTPDGTQVWIPNAVSNDVLVLDRGDGHPLGRIPTGRNPLHLAFSADGATAYLSERDDGSLAVLDTATRTVRGRVLVGPRPDGVVTGPRAWMTNDKRRVELGTSAPT